MKKIKLNKYAKYKRKITYILINFIYYIQSKVYLKEIYTALSFFYFVLNFYHLTDNTFLLFIDVLNFFFGLV